MDFGVNLAGESVNLFQEYEQLIESNIALKNKEIERLVNEMDDLQNFLSMLAEESDSFEPDSDHVVRFEDRKRIALIERLMQNEELRHIFPPTKFSWENEEIPAICKELQTKIGQWQQDDNLKRMINQRIEGYLQRTINRKTEEIMLDQHDLGKAAELFNKGLGRMTNLISVILQNIQRAH